MQYELEIDTLFEDSSEKIYRCLGVIGIHRVRVEKPSNVYLIEHGETYLDFVSQ